ncbi:HAD domain-containing protein [Kitasatospora indigofera]|uniref:HAD domain-containing protein n=1 Tax=Kitasatospora indigofera TaxID=67307 RepID=UPI0036ADD809
MPKPLLFLDVDGVLNPAAPHPDAGFEAHALLGYRVLLSARHADWLRELAGGYQLVWATTWEEEATGTSHPCSACRSCRWSASPGTSRNRATLAYR